MCGRYSLLCIDVFGRTLILPPGSTNPVIVAHERAENVMMQWGLVPNWARDITAIHRLINARAENFKEKPIFRDLLRTKRCLVPASGFFEWKQEWGQKIPFYFYVKNDPVFAFAGLYDVWHNPAGTTLATYTIITTPANSTVAPIHRRMPAILRQEDEIRWISHYPLTAEEMQRILAPYPTELIEHNPVSDRVNNMREDDERVIQPLRGL